MIKIDYIPSLSIEKVAVFSRDPKIAQYIEHRFLNLTHNVENQNEQLPITLSQGKATTLNLRVKAWEAGLLSTVVNCVDLRNNSVVKSWLIEVEGKDTVA